MDWIGRLFKSREKTEVVEPKEYICTFLDRGIFRRGVYYVADVNGDEIERSKLHDLKENILREVLEGSFLNEGCTGFSCYSFEERKCWSGEKVVDIFFEDLRIGCIQWKNMIYFQDFVDDDVREKFIDDLAEYNVKLLKDFEEEQKRKREKAREILNCK